MNLFLKAAKLKYRFQTNRGLLNTEQLFDLGQQDLHELYLSLESHIQKSKGLLGRSGNTEIEDKLVIVKEVFDSLVEDQEKALAQADKARMKEVLLEKAAEKEIEELVDGKSAKELRKAASKM